MSLKNLKTLRKLKENLKPQMAELQFLRTLIFPKAHHKLQNSVKFRIFSVKLDTRVNIHVRK